ncbi:MAG: hypothetical protein LCH58_09935 [Bacteroidetes bacterium]|uniref:hypothetical protein n=1 Tax=Phnomibacter sp. TaxID=2836217 RepID=UPI002FDD8674|nr:hypothetical protein [Bacteroidota bacterium]
METKKMSLATVAGKLSRAEMKNVMAGNDQTDGSIDNPKCLHSCDTDADCGTDCPKCKKGATANFCEMS